MGKGCPFDSTIASDGHATTNWGFVFDFCALVGTLGSGALGVGDIVAGVGFTLGNWWLLILAVCWVVSFVKMSLKALIAFI